MRQMSQSRKAEGIAPIDLTEYIFCLFEGIELVEHLAPHKQTGQKVRMTSKTLLHKGKGRIQVVLKTQFVG